MYVSKAVSPNSYRGQKELHRHETLLSAIHTLLQSLVKLSVINEHHRNMVLVSYKNKHNFKAIEITGKKVTIVPWPVRNIAIMNTPIFTVQIYIMKLSVVLYALGIRSPLNQGIIYVDRISTQAYLDRIYMKVERKKLEVV